MKKCLFRRMRLDFFFSFCCKWRLSKSQFRSITENNEYRNF